MYLHRLQDSSNNNNNPNLLLFWDKINSRQLMLSKLLKSQCEINHQVKIAIPTTTTILKNWVIRIEIHFMHFRETRKIFFQIEQVLLKRIRVNNNNNIVHKKKTIWMKEIIKLATAEIIKTINYNCIIHST